MAKRIISSALALVLVLAMSIVCSAAEPSTVVEYDGSNITYTNDGKMTGFENMLPGVPYEGAIQLKNVGEKEANFYMDTEVVSTLLGVDNVKDTSYRVSLSVGDNVLVGYDAESDAVTGTIVGGEGTTGLEELNKQLEEYPLVATLDPGQTADVVLSITPDATATNVSYMGVEGKIEFRFQAADVPDVKTVVTTETVQGEPNVVTQVRTIVVSAKTGDFNTIAVCAVVVVLAAVVLLVLTKKKKKEEASDAQD